MNVNVNHSVLVGWLVYLYVPGRYGKQSFNAGLREILKLINVSDAKSDLIMKEGESNRAAQKAAHHVMSANTTSELEALVHGNVTLAATIREAYREVRTAGARARSMVCTPLLSFTLRQRTTKYHSVWV